MNDNSGVSSPTLRFRSRGSSLTRRPFASPTIGRGALVEISLQPRGFEDLTAVRGGHQNSEERVKITDDYTAKIRIWARERKVFPLPEVPPLPRFGVRRFRSHAEMNAWKAELIRETARIAAQRLRRAWTN